MITRGLASEDRQAPRVGHGERWNGGSSGGVAGQGIDRVALPVALRHGGVDDAVLDREARVVEHDAELLGDAGDDGAVQVRVPRGVGRREADRGDVAVVDALRARRGLLELGNLPALHEREQFRCGPAGDLDAQEGVPVVALAVAYDTTPGLAEDELRREQLVQRELVGGLGVAAELRADEDVRSSRALGDEEDALLGADRFDGGVELRLGGPHLRVADDPEGVVDVVRDVQDVEDCESGAHCFGVHGFASQAMFHRLGANRKPSIIITSIQYKVNGKTIIISSTQ